jgi:hypothetical protein
MMRKVLFALLLASSNSFAVQPALLSWDYGTYDLVANPDGLTATNLLRKAEACTASALTFAPLASVPFPTLTFTDSTVSSGKSYCYEAQSVNPAGVSSMSNQVVKVIPFGIPPAPTLK